MGLGERRSRKKGVAVRDEGGGGDDRLGSRSSYRYDGRCDGGMGGSSSFFFLLFSFIFFFSPFSFLSGEKRGSRL